LEPRESNAKELATSTIFVLQLQRFVKFPHNARTESIVYNHSRPIVNVFTKINQYAQMADHANASATQAQLIYFGTIVLTASTRFASDIRKWHAKPELDKTWQAFKTHFIEAQKAIHDSEPAVTTDSLRVERRAVRMVTVV
jgi:hypothetical protein